MFVTKRNVWQIKNIDGCVINGYPPTKWEEMVKVNIQFQCSVVSIVCSYS
jgi:hypothetical protein